MGVAYSYVVVDRAGRRLRGEIQATGIDHATNQLRQRGDTVVEVNATASEQSRLRLQTSVSLSDLQLADFAFDLRSLVASGAPLPRALATLAESAGSKRASSLARDLKLQLELGNSASAVLIQGKTSSLRLFGRFLSAAEQGGRYDVMLGIAADFLTQRATAFEKVRSALAYPMFLLTISMAAIGFLVIYVAPSLAPMFEGTKAPAFIAITSSIGGWVQANVRLSLLVGAIVVGGAFLLARSPQMKRGLAAIVRAMPVLGRIANDLDFGPAVLTYSALLRSAWPAERALRLTSEISQGRVKQTFVAVSSSLRDGATLTESFRSVAGIPLEVLRAVEIGEQTGTVPDALLRAGEHLVARSLKSLDRLSSVLGPVMIAAIGGLVASLMISLLSSIASLGDAVS